MRSHCTTLVTQIIVEEMEKPVLFLTAECRSAAVISFATILDWRIRRDNVMELKQVNPYEM